MREWEREGVDEYIFEMIRFIERESSEGHNRDVGKGNRTWERVGERENEGLTLSVKQLWMTARSMKFTAT